jgi:O-antigen/teichoic acid export membrane protein
LNQPTKVRQPGSRVASGVAAHLYSQLITIITQLAGLPIFLQRWSADEYGQWLAISAVPAYLAIADVGILTAAGNLMSMHQARGEPDKLKQVFKAGLLVIFLVVPCFALLVGLLLLFLHFGLSRDQRGALFILTLAALMTVASGLFDALYRPYGKYPRVAFLLTTARVLEYAGTIAGLFTYGTLTSVAVGFLSGRVLAFAAMYVLARRDIPDVQWNLRGVNPRLVTGLAKAGVGFVSINFGSLLTLQGMIVLVGAQLGGTAVAIFSANRTLTRMLAQIAVLSGKSLAPEISALYGANNHSALEKLSRQMVYIVMSVTIIGAVALAHFGPPLLSYWSRGKLPFDRNLFSILLLTAVTTAYWQMQSVRLTATNRHQLLAFIFVIASVLALLVAYAGMSTYGIDSAAVGMLAADGIMILGATVALRRAALLPKRAHQPVRQIQ